MEIHDRLKKMLDSLPGSVEQKAKETGTSTPTLYGYLKGETLPNTKYLISLRKATGINLNWLLLGEGSPTGGGSVSDDFIRLAQKFDDYIELHRVELGGLVKYAIIVDAYNFLSTETNFSENPDGVDVDSLFRLILKKWDDASARAEQYEVKETTPVRYNPLIHGNEAEFLRQYPNGVIEHNIEDQLLDMADSIDAYIDSVLQNISDDELTRERVKGVIKAVLEHFETERQKSA